MIPCDRVGVLIVDDHPEVRSAVGRLVICTSGWSLVGAVATVDAAVIRVADGGVDLVLADVVMPDGGGLVLARALDELDGAPPVVLMSSYDGDDVAPGAVDGAIVAGFVTKSELSPDRLRSVWRQVTGAGLDRGSDDGEQTSRRRP